jgi:DNA repair protein RecO (recombination protein O)
MALVETEAIILRNMKLGEADKIAVALTRHEGVVRGVAKGARKLKSKYGAGLEPFTVVRLTFYEKEARELVSISEAEIIKSYFSLTRDDAVFTTLERMAGLVLEFAPLRAPDERFFRMIKACLEALEQGPGDAPAVALYSDVWVLRLSGFLPDLTRCASCRASLEREQKGAFLSAGSALICAGCSNGQGLFLGREALALLASALKNSPSDWVKNVKHYQTNLAADSAVRQALYTLTARALEREPRFRAKAESQQRIN